MSTKMNKETINLIIPDQLQNELMNRGEGISDGLWGLGDTVELIVAEKPSGIRKETVYTACAVLSGLSTARIADLRATSVYYPEDIRDEYDSLTFSHFLVAKAAGSIEESERYLKIAVESADDYGGVRIPVDALRALMEDNGDIERLKPWERYLNSAYTSFDKIISNKADEEIPEPVVKLATYVTNRMEKDFEFGGEDE